MFSDRPFEDPIVAPNGRPLKTLRDAAKYIQKLPKPEHDKHYWLTAGRALIMAAEGKGQLLHARAGMLQALRGQSGTSYDPGKSRAPAKSGDAGDDRRTHDRWRTREGSGYSGCLHRLRPARS